MNKVSWMLSIGVVILWAGIGVVHTAQEETVLAMNLPVGSYETSALVSSEEPGDRAVAIAAEAPSSSSAAGLVDRESDSDAGADTDALMPPLLFHTVNGVALTDDLKTVYEMKGQPSAIVQDEIIKNIKTYQFDDCSITMIDGAIEYVVVPGTASRIDIDGQLIPLNLASIKKKLGTPYFVSEDGIVYRNGTNALKIYIDPASNKLMSVHYFHTTSQ
ncbi:hypothetical protein ACFQ88_20245 [Paenibacillus sp. NPDC056579]|uniref:hypothetical protein n=1 Tax=Paenibacillus sp. NPDC056579 TaxID=3345871 RepID=UPI0036BDB7E7